jgi:hypothetical protein
MARHEDLRRLRRDELTGVDVRSGGWQVRGATRYQPNSFATSAASPGSAWTAAASPGPVRVPVRSLA